MWCLMFVCVCLVCMCGGGGGLCVLRPVGLWAGVPACLCCEWQDGRLRAHAQGPLDTESMLLSRERARGERREESRLAGEEEQSLARGRGQEHTAGRRRRAEAGPGCRSQRGAPSPPQTPRGMVAAAPRPRPRALHAGLDFQARRWQSCCQLSSFRLNGNRKQQGEVGGWGAGRLPRPAANPGQVEGGGADPRREEGAGGRRERCARGKVSDPGAGG